MKKILVPSDLSAISENALKLAVDIAGKAQGAEIFLVNFTEHPAGESFTAMGEINKKYAHEENVYTITLVRKYQEQLSKLAAKYTSPSLQINYQVYDEELKPGIVKYIPENQIDLVIMGTSGEESTDEFFSGNHTQQVMEVATCPVISIREPYEKPDFTKIVLGLSLEQDKHDNYSRAASYLNQLSELLDAHIDVVNILEPGTYSRSATEKRLADLIAKCGLKTRTVQLIEHVDKEEGLLNFANEHAASFLAVLTHADDSFFRIFRSSLSEDLSMSSNIPVISVNLHNI